MSSSRKDKISRKGVDSFLKNRPDDFWRRVERGIPEDGLVFFGSIAIHMEKSACLSCSIVGGIKYQYTRRTHSLGVLDSLLGMA